MSDTTRIPVSLDNIDRFSEENARNIANDGQAMAILNEWFDPLFARQSLDESHPAGRRRATVGERFNTLYIYHRQGNTDGFVGFYDYYRGKLTPQEKNSFDQLEESDKEIRLRAAVYATAASSEPVLAMQIGMNGDRPAMEVMYPKVESTAEIPPEAFSLFARFLRKVLPKSMYPDSIKTQQELAISRAEDIYESIKGDVTAAAEALTDKVAEETEGHRRDAARMEAQAPQAHELMIAEARRRQFLGIDENAEQKEARADFLFNQDFVAKRDDQIDDSLYAKNMHSVHRVKEDFPNLWFENIKYDSLGMPEVIAQLQNDSILRPVLAFNIPQNVKGNNQDKSKYGLQNLTPGLSMFDRYAWHTAPTYYTGAHEAGHSVSFDIVGMMRGKQPYKEEPHNYSKRVLKKDLSNRTSEQNFAKEAMLRAYDLEENDKFRKDMDRRVMAWEKSIGNITIDANSTPSQKRDRATQFISQTMVSEAPKSTSIDDRKDMYASLYAMGYTSVYGSSNASEFMAEAFADYYYIKETNKNLKRGEEPLRTNPLSDQVVKLAQELHKSPLARLRFAEKYGGYDLNMLREQARPELEAEAAKQEAEQQKQQNPQAQQANQPPEQKVQPGEENKVRGQGPPAKRGFN